MHFQHSLPAQARRVLHDPALRASYRQVTTRFIDHRTASLASIADADTLLAAAADVRADAVQRMPELIAQFAEAAAARGVHIHLAATPDDARAAIIAICQQRGARRAVKSKSMTTEELHLNAALEAVGVAVVETDLGERIIQLADEPPAHIVAPSIEFDRDRVSGLFQRHLAQPATRDIGELTRQARATLREEFRAADVGITGANYLIAETGSLVIVTNEGNGRLCASAPPLHIAVVGVEKVIATLADLAPMQRALMRGSTGQAFTSYMQILSGPRRDGSDSLDGPDEMHVVLLDAGRSMIREDEPFADVLRCIRCSSCINVCPVYNRAGARAYGWVYPGPVGTVLTSLHFPDRMADLAEACSLCGHCTAVCPVGIDLEQMHLDLRARVHGSDDAHDAARRAGGVSPRSVAPVAEDAGEAQATPDDATLRGLTPPARLGSFFLGLYAFLARHPAAWNRLIRLAGFAGRLVARLGFGRNGWLRRSPVPWTIARDAPLPARESFQQWWAREGETHYANAPAHANQNAPGEPGVSTPGGESGEPGPLAPAVSFAERLVAAGGRVITDLETWFRECATPGDVLLDGFEDQPTLRAQLSSAATAAGRRVRSLHDVDREQLFKRVEIGVTLAWRGLADTGTVLELAGPQRSRLTSLVPPHSLVVLQQEDLRETIAAALDDLPRPLPAAVTFITGPSRTADIEQTLTIGVHGPLEMAIVVV